MNLSSYASYWYRMSKGTQYPEDTVLFQTSVPLKSQATGWQITCVHTHELHANTMYMFVCSHTPYQTTDRQINDHQTG